MFREKSANEITDFFVDMYINVPVEEWGGLLEAQDIPNLRLGMCAYFGTVMTLLYSPEVVDDLAELILDQFQEYDPKIFNQLDCDNMLFFSIPEDLKVFCLQEFLPEIRNATEDIELSSEEFIRFEVNALGTVFKLLYAFVWQVRKVQNQNFCETVKGIFLGRCFGDG